MHPRTRLLALVGFACCALALPCMAQDRWQITLHTGAILWDLELIRLAGDTLVLRHTDSDSTLRLPVMRVDELRLVQKAEKRQGAPDAQGTGNALMGGTDLLWQLTLLDRPTRLRVLHQILKDYPPDTTTAR